MRKLATIFVIAASLAVAGCNSFMSGATEQGVPISTNAHIADAESEFRIQCHNKVADVVNQIRLQEGERKAKRDEYMPLSDVGEVAREMRLLGTSAIDNLALVNPNYQSVAANIYKIGVALCTENSGYFDMKIARTEARSRAWGSFWNGFSDIVTTLAPWFLIYELNKDQPITNQNSNNSTSTTTTNTSTVNEFVE